MFHYYLFFLFISLIESCPLKTVDSRSGCYCGIEIDGTNYIQCQPYSIEIIPEFTRSYIYDKLNLSFNFIRNITYESFNKLRVKKIYLQNNLIEFIDKQSFNNNLLNYLEELHIDILNNGSLEVFCYGTWQKLRILELSGFNLNQHQSCFEKFHRLEKLIIKNSKINFLSSYLYQLPYLHELSLINNQIEYLNFDINNNNDNHLTLPSSQSSSSIKIFNLTSNQIRTISNDLFQHMPLLHTLDLSHNFIENLPLINQNNLLNINLSYNLINYIQLNDNQTNYDLSYNPICTLEKSQSKKNLFLKKITQLHCDCRLAFYLNDNLINKSKIIGINQPFDNETKCSTPISFHGLFLKDLTYEQLFSTCSDVLPVHCREVNHFQQIQNYTNYIMETTTTTITTTTTSTIQSTKNTTQIDKVTQKLNNRLAVSSFRLTSFYTSYENHSLTIYWDFDPTFSLNSLTFIQFQIILEQESSSNTQIIRRSGFISPYLKQYTIHHIPSNKNYYVCLLLTRSSFGTDKYCREARTKITTTTTTTTISNTILSKQAFVRMLFANRSIVFGFLFGTILTTSLLLTLAFLCHLRSKRQCYRRAASSLFNHHYHHQQQQQKHYLYVDRNDDDGTYSNSILSSSSKYNHFKRSPHRTCFPSLPSNQSWYRRGLTQLPITPLPPTCCFHHHHHHHLTPDATISSSSTTTRRITSLSSQYSNEMDKEQMTSTSIMSSTSSDEQTHHSPAKHVYEELADETTMLRLNNATDAFL
ncbi:unnamed protein product [Rotaria sordida]|uniref:Uncharacterized protein n=1 Tax=Rotaria sordida TaxID=392033 RepID=A0A814BFZ1_9BILA|nr:unnamed protein product [Rotaria sordida]CAF3746039.1 unnamed protein product [Rotaria sordida]